MDQEVEESTQFVEDNVDDELSCDAHSIKNNNTSNIPDYCQLVKFTDSKGNTKELLLPKNLDLERPKRSRTNFTTKQLNSLEAAFAKNQYLVGRERKSLSKELNLSEAQIKVWYQNRRTKYKREQFKEKEKLEANAESIAASNVMRLLQNHHEPQAAATLCSSVKPTNQFYNHFNNTHCKPHYFYGGYFH